MKMNDYFKAIFCSLGHAIIFFIFLFCLADSPQLIKLFGPLLFEVATNVFQINLLVYIPYALILYGLWLNLQFWILHRFRQFSIQDFFSKKFTKPYLILCGLGYINLFFWLMGMEGNAFGFLFALPLLLLAFFLAVLEVAIFFNK